MLKFYVSRKPAVKQEKFEKNKSAGSGLGVKTAGGFKISKIDPSGILK